jgi:alanine racemase
MSAAKAIIHIGNLRENFRLLNRFTGEPVKVCCAVKADAYGHGALQVSNALIEEGATHLAVATVDEGISLREGGITIPILLFTPALPEDYQKVISNNLTPLIFSLKTCRELEGASKKAVSSEPDGRRDVHLLVDTGMGRLGCKPDEALELARYISGSEQLRLAGTCSHFPSADRENDEFTRDQGRLFDNIAASFKKEGIDPGLIHMANSGGIAGYPSSHRNMVRPGILLYGYYPSSDQKRVLPVKPVMELITRLVHIKKVPKGRSISYGRTYYTPRDTYIGTVAAGYADGYSRLLSNRASVSIRDRLYPVVGTVCMDLFMVDIGPECVVSLYDEVILFGPQRGAEGPGAKVIPTAETLADIIGSIPYEITCGVSKRVKRLYLDP